MGICTVFYSIWSKFGESLSSHSFRSGTTLALPARASVVAPPESMLTSIFEMPSIS